MKFLTLPALLFLFIAASCNKETLPDDFLSVPQDTIWLGSTIQFERTTLAAKGLWKITKNESWLNVVPMEGTGDTTLRFYFDANHEDYNTRTATLTITSAEKAITLTVIQDPQEVRANMELFAGGGEGWENREEGNGGHKDGLRGHAEFEMPKSMTFDPEGNLYLVDHLYLRKITPQGLVSTLPRKFPRPFENPPSSANTWEYPVDVVVDKQSNLYLLAEKVLYKITPAGETSPFAGGPAGSTESTLFYTNNIEIESNGDILIADGSDINYNCRIRRIKPSGAIIAEAGGRSYHPYDGIGTSASFEEITVISMGPGNILYVGDQGVRKVTPPNAAVSTIIYTPQDWSANGPVIHAGVPSPTAMAVDKNGYIYTYDLKQKLRLISPKGLVYTIPLKWKVGYCESMVVGPDNALYLAALHSHKIFKITLPKMPR